MIKEILKEIGLNEKETAIYLALLKLGTAPASILGKHTKIRRSTAQYTCQQLVQKGIIKSLYKKNAYYYTPEPPEKLLYIIDRNIERMKDNKADLNRHLSELTRIMNPHTVLPKVTFYEGVDGLIELFEEQLKLEDDDIAYGMHRFYETSNKRFNDYVYNVYDKKRKSLNYKSFLIWADNKKTLERVNIHKGTNRTSLIIPDKNFPIESSYQLYKNKVAFYSYRETELTGVLINNAHMYTTMLTNFKLAWNHARTLKINKKYKDVVIP